MKSMASLVLWILVCLMLPACELDTPAEGPGEEPPETAPVMLEVGLDEEEQERLGLRMEPLVQIEYEERIDGPGVVLDAEPIVQMLAERAAAEAAARQSRAASERAAALFGSDAAVSREVLEAAERQTAADEAALDVARARALVAYGAAAPWLEPARRARATTALTNGSAVVVRASFPGGFPESGAPDELTLRRVGEGGLSPSWRSSEVWTGPADPAVPGPSLLAYVEPAQGLVSGARVVASFGAGMPLHGVRVPSPAVVFAGGAAWCYVATDDDTFVRTEVDISRPVDDGYFQARGFTAGAPVVVAGAGLLLASELGGAEEED